MKKLIMITVLCTTLNVSATMFPEDIYFEKCVTFNLNRFEPNGFGVPFVAETGNNFSFAIGNRYYDKVTNTRFSSGGHCIHYYSGENGDPKISVAPISVIGPLVNKCVNGSIIDPVKGTVSESIPVEGTELNLVYSSEYNPKTAVNRTIQRNYKLSTDFFSSHTITLTDDTTNFNQAFEYPALPNINFNFLWDGITGNISNNIFLSKLKYRLLLSRKVVFPDLSGSEECVSDVCKWIPTVLPYTFIFKVDSLADQISLYHADTWGLKGWTIDQHHYFDSESRMLFSGQGQKISYKNYRTITLPEYGQVHLVNENASLSEVYVFDFNGRHLETRTGLTSAIKFKFLYDSSNKITGILDIHHKLSEFIYDNSGNIIKIKSSFGQETLLTTNGNQLSKAELPGGQNYSMTYDTSDLLKTFKKPNQVLTTFSYDVNGIFSREDKTTGLFQEFLRTSDAIKDIFEYLTDFGTKSRIEIERTSNSEINRTISGNGDLVSQTENQIAEKTQIIVSNEVSRTLVSQPDSMWGEDYLNLYRSTGNYIIGETVTTEIANTNVARIYSDNSNPLSLNRIVAQKYFEQQSLIKRTSVDIANKVMLDQSIPSRPNKVYFNEKEQITRIEPSVQFPTDFIYNSDGKLSQIVKGVPIQNYSYDSLGYLSSFTNSKNQMTSFVRNASGQVLEKILPNLEKIKFEYTSSGEVAKITTPSNQVHNFNLSLGDYLQSYMTPNNKSTNYEYDVNRRLTKITKPSGRTINYIYKPNSGELTNIQTVNGSYQFNNIDPQRRPRQVISTDQITTEMNWVGNSITQQKTIDSDGSEIGTIKFEFEQNRFRLKNILLNGSVIANYVYRSSDDRILRLNNYSYSYSDINDSYIDQTSILNINNNFNVSYLNQDINNGSTTVHLVSARAIEDPDLQLFIDINRTYDVDGQAREYSTTTVNSNMGVVRDPDLNWTPKPGSLYGSCI